MTTPPPPPFLRIDDESPGNEPPDVFRIGKVAWDANGAYWRLVVRGGVSGWELVAAFKRLEPVQGAPSVGTRCGHEMDEGRCPKAAVGLNMNMAQRCEDHR